LKSAHRAPGLGTLQHAQVIAQLWQSALRKRLQVRIAAGGYLPLKEVDRFLVCAQLTMVRANRVMS
jgi:hypothetical protein